MSSDRNSAGRNRAGLVLTGGGARAAYQVGAISALAEILPRMSIPFPVLSGTSAGGINIAYLASHATSWPKAAQDLRALWHSLHLEKIYRTDGLSLGAIAMSWISRTILGGRAGTRKNANYLLSTQPLRELLSEVVSFDQMRRSIMNGHIQGVSFTATHYFEGRSISFFEAAPEIEEWRRSNRAGIRVPLSVEHVMASAAIPVFFPPVVIEDVAYGDGCLRQTTPLSPAIHLGADRLLCIGIRPERRGQSVQGRTTKPSLAQIGGEMMNALFLDSLESDIERMMRINQSMQAMDEDSRRKHFGELRQIPILSLRPSRDLAEVLPKLLHTFPAGMRYLLKGIGTTNHEGGELLSYLAFEAECVGPLMELGYQDTLQKKSEIIDFMA